ncbi:MAG: hypothetical protein K9N55_05895 [Phycisphaerae bacterium]|nr:hypothetical protein [Phycisphaerae bacterium]
MNHSNKHAKTGFNAAVICLAVFVATLVQAADTVKPASRYAQASDMLLENGVTDVVFAERYYGNDGHWYANFGYFFDGPDNVAFGKNGGKLQRLDIKSGKVTTLFEDKAGSIRDPAVHYEALKIIFSYRKGGTMQFHLYEINADGSGLRQLTDGIYDELEPTYLPDGGLAFVSSRSKRWVQCWLVHVATLYRSDGNGQNIRLLSANIEQDNTPSVLHDGRLLFTRWEYVDRSQVQFHHLWTCNPDGTNQTVFYGNMHPNNVFIDARPIPGSDRVVFVDSPGHGAREHEGNLSTVTEKQGPDDRSANKKIGNVRCRDPFAINENCFMVAGPRCIQVVDGSGNVFPLYHSNMDIHEPRPLIRRERERVIASHVDLSKAKGTLVLDNVYIGRNMKGIKKGEIKKLMVLETLPKPLNYGAGQHDFIPISHGGTFTLERILGTVPVESDGSAHFELPANRPLFFIAVNENNESIKRMHSFLSVMPGEILSCIGCHEERVKTPRMRPSITLAIQRPASQIEPIAGLPYMIDFPTHVQPILDKHCVECHNPDKPEGRIMLTGDHGSVYSQSYMTLTTAGYVSDGRNNVGNTAPRSVGDSASRLMTMLDGSHYGAKLSVEDVEMIRNWIHVGAPYPGTSASLGTGMVRPDSLTKGYGPARTKAEKAFQGNCLNCHKNVQLPRIDQYSIAGLKNKQDYFWDTHMAYNLSKPEKSPLLLAPLARDAGGWGTCRARSQSKEQTREAGKLFEDTDNSDYQAILAYVEEGKRSLERNKRWDMPGFKPHPYYVREMKRYGILPETFSLEHETDIDVFEIDRRYWESSWYYPNHDGPKLFPNETLNKMMISPKRGIPWENDVTRAMD